MDWAKRPPALINGANASLIGIPTRPATPKARTRFIKQSHSTSDCSTEMLTESSSITAIAAIFDFGHSSQQRAWFGAEGGEMSYYFFYGPSMKKILSRYADLTGHMPMPPMWALGNQQSRWSYYPETTVEEVARQYRERDLPLDVIHRAIIPLGPQMNYVGEKSFNPLTFEIYPDDDGSAATTLYEDDGVSPAYQRGVFRRTIIDVKRAKTGYVVNIAAPTGNYNPGPREFSFVIKSSPTPKFVRIADEGRGRTI